MIAILCARSDSIYFDLPNLDVYDITRDARSWRGGCSVIAHPPCRAWGRLRAMAKPRPDEKELARFCVRQVQSWGGVLEHPMSSTLWADQNLPRPGRRDNYGGFTLPVDQRWWGHRCSKATLLYITGIEPRELPTFPISFALPTHSINGRLPEIPKSEREKTPPDLARWLIQVATLCEQNRQKITTV